MPDWSTEFPAAITVCDREGVIVAMNDRAAQSFAADGGRALIGTNALDCHPPAAREKMERLLATGAANVYTIEKSGVKKLIYQAPWYQDGVRAGIVELSFELPAVLPHFIRGG